jgi:predicted RNase H-like nuclease
LAHVVGVDGCAGGWIAASRDVGAAISVRRVAAFEALFETARPEVLAVDVPIGLPEKGARDCDLEARRLLGVRRSSVFAAPIRPMLAARSQAGASRIRHRVERKRVSIQTWAIAPKIIEVDSFLRADSALAAIVREVHPKVSFFFLNGERPMSWGKRKVDGRAERVSALRRWCGEAIAQALAERGRLECHADDVLDAFVALWTAERISCGVAISIPAAPPLDAHGLRMEMMA